MIQEIATSPARNPLSFCCSMIAETSMVFRWAIAFFSLASCFRTGRRFHNIKTGGQTIVKKVSPICYKSHKCMLYFLVRSQVLINRRKERMKNKAVPLSLLITVLLLLRSPLLAGFVPAPEPNELPALLVAGAVAS